MSKPSTAADKECIESGDLILQATEALKTQFGLESFRPGQEAVVSRLLEGKSAAAIFPTGGGKSLCYQLPAVLLPGLTLVVSPLLALMREQVEYLRERGIVAERLDSTLDAAAYRDVHEAVRSGQAKLLYVAPERFFNERFREFISGVPISLFAIDEAHCISQWGHNFRPDYLKLAKIASELNVDRVLALTATATPTVLDDIRREFDIATEDAVQTPFYRSNLTIRCQVCNNATRMEGLVESLQAQVGESAIVYVSLQQTAETVAQKLADLDLPVRAYHAGLDDEVRREVQDWFMSQDKAIVVATIAFGMGIDKANIRGVYHFNPSKSVENFAQEIGRAGRDGLPAVCETFLVPEDRVVLDNFAYGDTPSLQSIRLFVECLIGQPESFFISHYSLSYECDIRLSVVRTLLTQLELEGVLEATSPRYDTYRFKPKKTSAEILRNFEGERRSFASSVLSQAVKKRNWFDINLAAATDRLKTERTRIVKMLDYFAEQGWIELTASGLVHGYRKVCPLGDIESRSQELYQYALDREIGELARLSELFNLLTGSQCLSQGLSLHFGQPLASECGHCGVCEGDFKEDIPEPEYPSLGDSALTGVKRLAKEHPDHLKEIRQQARFLCGLSSPRMIRARLTKQPLFGCCAEIPFDQVMDGLLEG